MIKKPRYEAFWLIIELINVIELYPNYLYTNSEFLVPKPSVSNSYTVPITVVNKMVHN